MIMLLRFKRLYILCNMLLLVGMLSIVLSTNAQSDPSPEGNQPLDVILLLDSSGSTIHKRGLIESAAGFLLDYLNTQNGLAQNYRLGVIGFNQDVMSDSIVHLGHPSKSDLTNFFVNTPAIGDTDFKPAIEFALEEFNLMGDLDGDSKPIIIIMTDGQPAKRGEVLEDLDSYFEDIQQLVTEVDKAGAALFVVAIGDAVADRERWKKILPEDQYAYVEDSRELSEVYWQFLSGFTTDEQDEIIELQTEVSQSITVEPYLDEITLTVLKNDPLATVKIVSPSGYEYAKDPTKGGGETDLHEIYVISIPDEGEWEVTLEGADGRLLINRRYPQVYLETDNLAVAAGSSFPVYAFIDSESLDRVASEDLSLYLADTLEDYQDTEEQVPENWIPFELTKDSYTAIVQGWDEPGLYSLFPVVLSNGKIVDTIESNSISIKVVHLPHITSLYVTQESTNDPFIIKYDIENDEAIQNLVPKLEIRRDGELIGSREMEDHDVTGTNTIPDDVPRPEGEYEIILRIEGLTPDNLNYSESYRITVNVIPPITATPLPTAAQLPIIPPETQDPPTPTPSTSTPASPDASSSNRQKVGLFVVILSIVFLSIAVLAFFVLKNRKRLNQEVKIISYGERLKEIEKKDTLTQKSELGALVSQELAA